MRSRFSLAFFVAVVVAVLGAGDAFAIIGRPLTPVSVAGVARRTVRRTAYAAPVAVGAAAAVGTAAPVGTAAAVAAHPSPYYARPAYYGGTVVYVH